VVVEGPGGSGKQLPGPSLFRSQMSEHEHEQLRRARMKQGCRPPYVGARRGVLPEYPTYWDVTEDIAPAIELLVADGQIEYEPCLARGAGGLFTGPALQTVVACDPPAKGLDKLRRKS
jgi:hypothetical protein